MVTLHFFGTGGDFREISKQSLLWRQVLDGQPQPLAVVATDALLQEGLYPATGPKAAVLAECSSTFDAMALLEEGQGFSSWDWVMACRQSQGRGQYGRQWHSPLGNLCVSQILPLLPPSPSGDHDKNFHALAKHQTLVPMLIAAVVVGVARNYGFPVGLKWPNDIVLFASSAEGSQDAQFQGAQLLGKAGGILLERRQNTLVWGLGLNFAPAQQFLQIEQRQNQAAASTLPMLPMLPAVTLGRLGLPEVPLLKFWQDCCAALQLAWNRWLELDSSDLHAEAEKVMAFRGEIVDFFEYGNDAAGNSQICCTRGRLLGLGASGELIMETTDGLRSKIRGSLRPVQNYHCPKVQ